MGEQQPFFSRKVAGLPVVAWIAGGLAASCFLAGALAVGVAWRLTARTSADPANSPATVTTGGPSKSDDSDGTALAEYIKGRAQDPSGLEIVSLEQRHPKKGGVADGGYVRGFVVRCKQLDHDPPLSRDRGVATYSKDGKVVTVHLLESRVTW